MSSNVGLSTPRGSGTSGYIQRNLSTLKPRDTGYGAPYPPPAPQSHQQRQPDQTILAHDRQRAIEVQVFELRDQLEEEGKEDEDEIERRCDELRRKLLLEEEEESGGARGGAKENKKKKGLKPHQVHELAEAKIKESERLRRALGIKEGREGRVWEDGK